MDGSYRCGTPEYPLALTSLAAEVGVIFSAVQLLLLCVTLPFFWVVPGFLFMRFFDAYRNLNVRSLEVEFWLMAKL